MFNPVYPFTTQVLEATINRGCHYFVRNSWPQGFNHFEEDVKGHYIFTHYNDLAKATAHFNSITNDGSRLLYDWNNAEQQAKLKIAAAGPAGYKIWSAYFLPNYKSKITNPLKDKINRYMYQHTNWKPGRGDTVAIDFFLEFGSLFITMRYAGEQQKVNFTEIENQR